MSQSRRRIEEMILLTMRPLTPSIQLSQKPRILTTWSSTSLPLVALWWPRLLWICQLVMVHLPWILLLLTLLCPDFLHLLFIWILGKITCKIGINDPFFWAFIIETFTLFRLYLLFFSVAYTYILFLLYLSIYLRCIGIIWSLSIGRS